MLQNFNNDCKFGCGVEVEAKNTWRSSDSLHWVTRSQYASTSAAMTSGDNFLRLSMCDDTLVELK